MLLFPEVLISIGQQCFNSSRFTTKGQGKRKQEQNGGVNSPFRKSRSRRIEKKSREFPCFSSTQAVKVLAENLNF